MIRLGGNTGEGSRAGFRGDNRKPQVIFISGFQSQDPEMKITPRLYRPEITGTSRSLRPELDLMPGDIDPVSAVTFSARFTAAAMFPLRTDDDEPQTSDTYVYGLVVDGGLYNTHQQQALKGLDALRQWGTMTGRDLDDAAARICFWPLYAQEMATKRVPNTHIVGGVKVTRRWKGSNYTSGANFTYHSPPIFNVNCVIDKKMKYMIQEVLTEFANDGVGESPERESGYSESTSK